MREISSEIELGHRLDTPMSAGINSITIALIGYIEQLHCVGLKNRFLQRQIVMFQDNVSTKEDNFSRSFRNAVHHALSSKFENVRQLKPVQEEALLQFIFSVLPTGCGKSLIFQLVPLVCAYLHNEKFNYPEKPILLVICLNKDEKKDHSLSSLQIPALAIIALQCCSARMFLL